MATGDPWRGSLSRLLPLLGLAAWLAVLVGAEDDLSASGLHRGRLMMRRESAAGRGDDSGDGSEVAGMDERREDSSDTDAAGPGADSVGSFYAPNSMLAKLESQGSAGLEEAGEEEEPEEPEEDPEEDMSFVEEEDEEDLQAGSGAAPYGTYCAKEGGVCACKGTVYYTAYAKEVDSEDLLKADFRTKNSDTSLSCVKSHFGNVNPRSTAQASCYCEAYAYFDYGYAKANACPRGTDIKSQEECAFAASKLGFTSKPSMTWTKHISGSSIRSGCNIREMNAPGEKTIYPVVWAKNGVSFVQTEEGAELDEDLDEDEEEDAEDAADDEAEGEGDDTSVANSSSNGTSLTAAKGRRAGMRQKSAAKARSKSKSEGGDEGSLEGRRRRRRRWSRRRRWWSRRRWDWRRRYIRRRRDIRRRRTRRRRTRRRYVYRRRRAWHRRRRWDRRRSWHRRRREVQKLTKANHKLVCREGRQLDGHSAKNMSATYCAQEGHKCACSGTVYFGQTMTRLKVKDIMTGLYKSKHATGSVKCSNSVFGDPKGLKEKFCFCSEDYSDDGAIADKTCTKQSSTGSAWSYYFEKLVGNSGTCAVNQYMRDWKMNPKSIGGKLRFDYHCCNYTAAPAQSPHSGRCITKQSTWQKGDLRKMADIYMKCEPGMALYSWSFVDSAAFKNHAALRYDCCEPPPSRGFGRCNDVLTERAAEQTDVRRMGHPAACPAGEAMTGWMLQHDKTTKEMWGRTTCCTLIEPVAALGQRRTCSWQGFPHIITFDGKAAEFERVGSGTSYVTWLVKSPDLRIQAQVTKAGSLDYVTGIVVGGDSLKGTFLKILKHGTTSEVRYNDKAVHGSLTVEGLGTIDVVKGSKAPPGSVMRVEVLFPGTLELSVVVWDVHIDGEISMETHPGEQAGHCGNNNGEAVDDAIPDWKVTNQENLFHPGKSAGTVGAAAPSISTCPAATLAQGTNLCGKTYTAGTDKQEFIDMCIWDYCFNRVPGYIAQDFQDQKLFEEGRLATQPRKYHLVDGKFNWNAAKSACPAGTRIATITSHAENLAAVEAAQAAKALGHSFVWLGGRKFSGAWRWDDGSVMAYQNWYKYKRSDTYLCMYLDHGSQWYQCKYLTSLPVLCVDDKAFDLSTPVMPHQMRDACGHGAAPAMPKTSTEQAEAFAAMKVHSGLVWLGGYYVRLLNAQNVKPFWTFLDGSQMGYTNWEPGQPDYTLREYDELFLCAKASTGKWRVCPSAITEQPVLCESEVPFVCTPGMLSNTADLKLSLEGERVAEVHDGHCYYLARAGEDCSQTCSAQTGGLCDEAGMAEMTQTLETCKNVANLFDMRVTDDTKHQYEVKAGERSCNYFEQSATSKRILFSSGTARATCSSKPSDLYTHRICACRAIHGGAFPAHYKLQPADAAVITAAGYTTDLIRVQMHTSKQDCTKPIIFDATKRTWSSRVGSGTGQLAGAQHWTPTKSDEKQWMEMDMGTSYLIKGIVTQGLGVKAQQVTSFQISYSIDKKVYHPLEHNFTYDYERYQTAVDFESPVLARYIKITPSTWHGAIAMKTGVRKCPSTGALELVANPNNKSMGWCVGSACNYVALWPFGAANQPFTMQVLEGVDAAGNAVFNVKVNGVQLDALQRPASTSTGAASLLEEDSDEGAGGDGFGLVTASGAVGISVSLEHPDTSTADVPVSMDSSNGVIEHNFESFHQAAATFSFNLKLTAGGTALRCIRCEADVPSVNVGNNIFEQNQQIVVDIEGNNPRRQTFDTKLNLNQVYNITISYVKADKTLDLYLGADRMESKKYASVKGVGISIRKGFLGGFHSNHNLLAGAVTGFSVSHALPAYRPEGQSCATFTCPTNWALKSLAAAVHCSGQVCDAKKDLRKCCDEVGSCNLFTWCPLNMVQKKNPSTIRCKDKLCKETDYSVCCEPKGMCTQTKCPAGQIQISKANMTHCIDAACNTDKDVKICCEPQATCETLKCPEAYSHKLSNLKQTCKGQRYCTNLLDRDLCCGKVGTCSSYKCPTNFTLKANAAHTSCADSLCQNTPFETCCAPSSSCTTMKCSKGKVLKGDAASLKCAGETCSGAQDEAQCCTAPELCSGLVCPAPTVHKARSDRTPCAGLTCSAAADKGACCSLPGRCSTVPCPKQYQHRWNAKKILCKDRTCQGEDFHRCCAEDGHCHTMKCAHGYVHRDEAKQIHCLHPQCKGATDNDRCCIKRAPCTDMTCPAHKIQKPNAANLTCKGAKCGSHDEHTCCGTPGRCDAFHCPTGMDHRHNAHSIFCDDRECKKTAASTCCVKDGACLSMKCHKGFVHKKAITDLECHAAKCGGANAKRDNERCCEQVSRCNSLVCPKPFVLKGNAPKLTCTSSVCDPKTDTTKCCDREGMCSTYKCPVNMLHKPNAAHIFCHDKKCEDTPFTTCCAEEGRCSSYTCPSGYYPNPAEVKTHCAGFKCTAVDRDQCCVKAKDCSGFSCPAGWVQHKNPDKLFCAGRTCDAIRDRKTCCAEEGKCTLFKCPDKYIHRANAHDIFCKDADCKSTAFGRCCAEEGKCSTLKCPAGQVLKDDADKLTCKGASCDEKVDAATCCISTSTCNSNACLKTQVLRADYTKHTCKGPVCKQADDNHECCSNKGFCPSFKCPDGFEHKHNATHIRCTDDTCAKTDYNHCCVEEGTCATYKCPTNFVRRPGAHSTHCKTLKCGEVDTPSCCQEVATCGGYECPIGHTLKGHPTKIKCAGAKCGKVDVNTCCAPEGRCDTMSCPVNFQHKAHAKTIWCDDQTCNSTDFKKCCSEDGACETLQCPVSYVHRVNLTGIHCEAWKCTVSKDRDVCCDRSAECADEVCPFDKVLKGNATNRFCQGSKCQLDAAGAKGCHKFNNSQSACEKHKCYWLKPQEHVDGEPWCTEKDIETCCAIGGTCSSMHCPNDYVLRAHSNKIYCSDNKCDADDYNRCCVEKNHCLGYKCPKWFVHKAVVANLFCKGASCSDKDRDLCCDPVATCNTMTCADGMLKRHHAEHLHCEGLNCTTKDTGTCCESQGHCGIYTCPYGWMHREGANKILCADSTCSATSYEKCCVEKARCTSMDCGIGYFPRAASANAYCAGATCKDSDTAVCCDKQDNCGSYECPAPYEQKPRPQEILCHGRTCSDVDLHSCCGMAGTCSAFTCPSGFQHRGNARHIPCPHGDCSQAKPESCCAPVGTCSTYHCPTGLVPVDGADAKQCQNGRCTIDDEGTCCVAAANCLALTCPPTHVSRPLAPHLYCKGGNCTNEDVDNCCAKKGVCSTWLCGAGMSHKFDSGEINCAGGNCTDAMCCAATGTCATFNCPAYAVRKPNATNGVCRAALNGGKGACTDADVGTCCDKKMPCSGFTCPAGKVWKEGYRTLFCAGPLCATADAEICCDKQAPCSDLSCGATGHARANATCAGATCVLKDKETCCQQTCDNFACPDNFVNRTGKETLLCSGENCGPGDELNCCSRRATCGEYGHACPAKHALRSAETLCKDAMCTADDEATCCAGTCDLVTCPDATHVPKAANHTNSSLLCGSFGCSASDHATCCSTRASCAGFTCPVQTVNRGDSVKCSGETCVPADFHSCCTSSCSTLDCVEGYVKKDDAASKLCKGLGCSDPADMQICCDAAASCTDVPCAAKGMANRGNMFHCTSSHCTAEDEAHCCLSTCSSYTCPAPYIHREHSGEVLCKGHDCNDHDDRDTCCAVRALCSTYECSSGLVMVDTDQYCAGIVCRETDAATCCKSANVGASGQIEYLFVEEATPGLCTLKSGGEPPKATTNASEVTAAGISCETLCQQDGTCWGYSTDTDGNCYRWQSQDLQGGGTAAHGEHCFLKKPKAQAMEAAMPTAAPQPCPTQVKMALGAEGGTTQAPPTDIIPQRQLNKKKKDNTITFFIVLLVVLSGGGLLALAASCCFRRGSPAGDAAAAPPVTMATPLAEDTGDF